MSAAGRRAVTHCQEHTDVPVAWECHVHRASHLAPKQQGLESSRLHCLGSVSYTHLRAHETGREHTDVHVPAAWECHVHRASHVAPKQPGLESSRLRCLGCLPFNRWSINVDDSRQSTSWSRLSSLSGANCWSVSSMAPLVSSVTGLAGASRSKAN